MTPSRDSLPLPDPSSQPIHDVIAGILRRLDAIESRPATPIEKSLAELIDTLGKLAAIKTENPELGLMLEAVNDRLARMEAYFCRSCWSAPHKHGSDLCRDCERQEYADVKSPPDEAGGES